MSKSYLLFLLFLFSLHTTLWSQTIKVTGTVRDANTLEALIGANVLYGKGKGTVTDFNGAFSLDIAAGTYTLEVSYVGYEPESKTITTEQDGISLDFLLEPLAISEVQVVADVARSRETPVAFSTVLPKQIEEQRAGRDLPMVLNSTPGIYATQQGGGEGDARITIRGFSQRNVGVLLDGIPVNDMENGWVYWSNWFGLSQVTRSMQVQRGLSASKLALPSVGGTINIITKGIENKRQLSLEEYIDINGKSTTSLGFTSGMLNGGWGVTLAASYKTGQSWVEGTDVEAFFGYLKIDKKWGDHITSITGYGAPQTHQQRSYKASIARYDTTFAKEQGVEPQHFPQLVDLGHDYNQHWGYLRRDAEQWNDDYSARIINANAKREVLSERVNTYFKPMFSLRDFWTVNDKFSISNIAYLSLGIGGGTQPYSSLNRNNFVTYSMVENGEYPYSAYGQINWQQIYDRNTKPQTDPFSPEPIYPINTAYSDSLYFAENYLVENRNEHIWYGYLSTMNYKLSNFLTLVGGIDLRSYKGIHYRQIEDLLGADYAIDGDAMKYEGDNINFYNEGNIRWGGVFGLIEYNNKIVSTFLNLSGYYSGYMKENIFAVASSPWAWNPGFTAKTGLNYNFTERMNAFFNLGYLSRVKIFDEYFYRYSLRFVDDTDNELIKTIEGGYTYKSPHFTANLNAYYTRWESIPAGSLRARATVGGIERDVYGQIANLDTRHTGLELDFVYQISEKWKLQGLFSWGDWIYDSYIEDMPLFDDITNEEVASISFDTRGVHVGDAAQTQVGGSLRYEPIQNLYFESRTLNFSRHYARFQPGATSDFEGNTIDSWKIPPYTLTDFHAGYRFKFASLDDLVFNVRFNVLNVFDVVYITDARNNDPYIHQPFNDFDAKSASVFFGNGRYYSLSLKITY